MLYISPPCFTLHYCTNDKIKNRRDENVSIPHRWAEIFKHAFLDDLTINTIGHGPWWHHAPSWTMNIMNHRVVLMVFVRLNDHEQMVKSDIRYRISMCVFNYVKSLLLLTYFRLLLTCFLHLLACFGVWKRASHNSYLVFCCCFRGRLMLLCWNIG